MRFIEKKVKEKPACSTVNMAVPVTIVCRGCGRELEIWSDEQEVKCPGCLESVRRKSDEAP